MATSSAEDKPLGDRLGGILHRLAAGLAVAGGVVLVLMTALVVVSIVGRALFSRPVPGDFEVVGFGTAVSIFLCIPYCYLERGNVAVDIFISKMPKAVQRAMDVLAAILFGSVAALFAWRMVFGLVDTLHYFDISMILSLPLWWAYPFGIVSFALLAASCFYRAVRIFEHGHE